MGMEEKYIQQFKKGAYEMILLFADRPKRNIRLCDSDGNTKTGW